MMSNTLFHDVRAFIIAHSEQVAPLHYHDWLIYALTRSFGRRWVYDATPRMLYRQHSGNDTGAQSSASGIVRRLQQINSGWYRKQVAGIVAVCRIADPGSEPANRADRMMSAARHSGAQRLRWGLFVLTSSRRRLRDRLILCVAALLGRL